MSKDFSTKQIESDASGNEFELREIVCPVCGPAATTTLGMRGGAYHRYNLGIATRIVQCRSCTLIFPNPFPFPRDSGRLYGDPEKYFAFHDEGEKVRTCRELICDIAEHARTPNPSILDVGSGRGELLEAARLEGLADIVGLETSPAMIEYARASHGIELQPNTIEQYAATASRRFDAVVLNAVIEHVYDPDSMMRAVAQLTCKGSVVYIDVPREPHLLSIVGNALNRIRGQEGVFNLSPTWPPYHVFGFNPVSMRRLLSKYGFRITSLVTRHNPYVSAGPQAMDRLKAVLATQINRVANAVGLASNMYIWCERVEN